MAKPESKQAPKPKNTKGRKYPKRLYVLSALGVVVILSGLIIWQTTRESQMQQEEGEVAAQTTAELMENDTDGDGVEDWRELLMGTNPLAFDSNNDGVGDNVVVSAAEQVLTARELERLRSEFPEATEQELIVIARSRDDVDNLTVTERLGRDIYMAGEVLNRMGLLTDEVREGISEEYFSRMVSNFPYPFRVNSDLLINTQASLRDELEYMDMMSEFLARNEILERDPLTLVDNAALRFEEEGEESANNFLNRSLDMEIARLAASIRYLDNTSIPVIFTAHHQELLNAYVRLAVDISEMQLFFEDPMRGYAAILRFQPNLEHYLESIQLYIDKVNQVSDQKLARFENTN